MEKNLRTMAIVLAELNASVNKYNESEDTAEQAKLADDHKNLTNEYNKLSLLSAYAECMAQPLPIVELAKRYYYTVVSVKDTPHTEIAEDGTAKASVTRGVTFNDRKFDVVKFIEWTSENNKCVAAKASEYKSEVEKARKDVEKEWEKFFASKGDTHVMGVGRTKKALQKMFDALVFVPCEKNKDKNAIIADGDVAKHVLGFSNNRKDSKVDGKPKITGSVLPASTWKVLILDSLYLAVGEKNYEIVYGDAEEDAKEKLEEKAEKNTGKADDKAEPTK